MRKVLLASQSFRRREFMEWLGIPYETTVSNFPEESVKFDDFDDPGDYAATIAMGKALTVVPQYPDALIITSDTIVYLDGIAYGKPKNLDHARQILQTLRGKTHSVYSGVVVFDAETQDKRIEVVKSDVTFGKFSDDLLEKYIATSEPYDKAGGYALQGFAKAFVEDVRGSALNVIGFPLMTVKDMLEEFGVVIDVDLEESIFEKTGYRF